MQDVIVTNELKKRFGDVWALRGLNLRVGKGITGFIGPNGAGKTVTVRILLGYLKPTSGEAFMFGYDCWKESIKIRKRVGVMLENPAYPRSIPCKKYLKMAAELRGYSRNEAEKVTDELLGFVGLDKMKDRPIGKLSAGMRRRFALANALIGEPEFLILDEPTANMDVVGRIDLLRKIEELHKERGIGIMVSTHILSELEKICTNVVFINNGVVIESGQIETLLRKYGLSYTKFEIKTEDLDTIGNLLKSFSSVKEVIVEKEKMFVKVYDRDKFLNEVKDMPANTKSIMSIREVGVERRLEALFETIFKREVKE